MKLCENIYNEPDKWRIESEYIFRHSSGSAIWIGNGFWFIAPHPGGHISFIDKCRLWRAFRWWQRQAPVEAYGRCAALKEGGE